MKSLCGNMSDKKSVANPADSDQYRFDRVNVKDPRLFHKTVLSILGS